MSTHLHCGQCKITVTVPDEYWQKYRVGVRSDEAPERGYFYCPVGHMVTTRISYAEPRPVAEPLPTGHVLGTITVKPDPAQAALKVAPSVNVIELRPSATPAIVARLEKLLASAQAGDLVGFVVAYEYHEGGVNGSWDMGPGCRPANLLGELCRMQFKLASRLDDGIASDQDIDTPS